ncbi:MAG: bacillithiol biosynthesis cysteine-adding enzyme BshC [Rhodothermia bacterium]|nr:MAG: bacillithiol biosynthesis cysteine-adding enzyme BshC [Rhodothermia bacterium]
MALDRLPYSDFKSFSSLFTAYASDFDSVAGYFTGDYRDPRQRGQIAQQVADQFDHRNELVEVLSEQNNSYGAGEATLRNIDRLAGSDAVAVVTGQQLGLFTGPMYTLYKTVTAVQLARQIEEESGRPAVPVFWLEGEDHDFEEVDSVAIQGRGGIQRIKYTSTHSDGNSTPVGRIAFDESIKEAVDQLDELLPGTEFHDTILKMVRNAYKPGTTFLTAFANIMGPLFEDEGLVFVSGDDSRLKKLARPLFRKELKEYSKTAALLKETSKKLEESHHAQVQSSPPNLFLITETGRHSLVADGNEFRLKGTDMSYSQDELLSMVEESPESFSPNVIMRPIVQDSILPTATYVAGPGEIAYFAQFRSIYEWAGVPMPIIYPRASVSLVEPGIAKVLDRYSLSIPSFEQDQEKIFHAIVVGAMDIDAEAIFERAGQHLHDAINTVSPAIEAVDASLRKTGEATRTALLKEWGKLKDRVVKAEKRRHDQTQNQLTRTQTSLFPESILQERCISPLYFMSKYGTDLVARLMSEIELDTTSHQVLSL